FPAHNPWFGVVSAGVYMLMSWVMPMPHVTGNSVIGDFGTSLLASLRESLDKVAETPSSLFWIALILLGFVAFTDTHKPVYKWVAGMAHGVANLFMALVVAIVTMHVLHPTGFNPADGVAPVDRLLLSLAELAGGYVLGAVIMGVYLAVSVSLFRRHGNDAFSALGLEGYKNFLRMRLDANGIEV